MLGEMLLCGRSVGTGWTLECRLRLAFMIAFCAFGDNSIAWLAEDNPVTVSMVLCWIHASTNPTYVSNPTFIRVIDLVSHLICL